MRIKTIAGIVTEPPHPTEPDVTALQEATKNFEEGTVIHHGDIAKIIGAEYNSCRYRTVVSAWVKRDRNKLNRDWRAVVGVGYELLPPPKRVVHCLDHQTSGIRKVKTALVIAKGTDSSALNKLDQLTQAHFVRTAAATLFMHSAFRKGLHAEIRKTKLLA